MEGRFIRFQEDDYHINKEIQEGKAAKKLSYLKGKGEYDRDAFLNCEEMKDVLSFVENWFNWKQGKYTVTFNVESLEAFTLKDNVYEFSLSVLDIELLMANKDLIRLSYEDQCKAGIKEYQPHNPTWNWVNPILKKAT